jgi:hypothetical protein
MSIVTFRYSISRNSLVSSWIASGLAADSKRELQIDSTTLTPEQRQLIIDVVGQIPTDGLNRVGMAYVDLRTYSHQFGNLHNQLAEFDKEITLDQALTFLATMRGQRQQIEADVVEYKAKIARDHAEHNAKLEAERLEREARKAAELAEVATWIAAHGSAHLKKAFKGGYDCARLYEAERADVEYPEAVLDFNDQAEFSPRSCPTEHALDIQETIKAPATAEVVWLTTLPSSEIDDEPTQPDEGAEAVKIDDPKYRHYLYIIL